MLDGSADNKKSLGVLREELWRKHPILMRRAVLPTPAVQSAIAIACKAAFGQRDSVAFWANPLSGKSSCVRSLGVVLARDFPGCGILVYEAKKKQVCAEGAFLEDVLDTMNFEVKKGRTLSAKRTQTMRALYAHAAPRGHLFLIIDEAQEMAEGEFCWLKAIINWLVERDCCVTVLLFGQHELLDLRQNLITKGRSDLHARYMAELYEFENIHNEEELQVTFAACDSQSEYPANSGWSYTRFLWPEAFAHGFTLAKQASTAWLAFVKASPNTGCAFGVSMRWVARVLAELADATKDEDRASFGIDPTMWATAIERAGYVDEKPLVRRKRRKK